MTKEVRGMLIGACIVVLAFAAWYLEDKPRNAPGGAGTATTAPERK